MLLFPSKSPKADSQAWLPSVCILHLIKRPITLLHFHSPLSQQHPSSSKLLGLLSLLIFPLHSPFTAPPNLWFLKLVIKSLALLSIGGGVLMARASGGHRGLLCSPLRAEEDQFPERVKLSPLPETDS